MPNDAKPVENDAKPVEILTGREHRQRYTRQD
jgi:hypothetical protein